MQQGQINYRAVFSRVEFSNGYDQSRTCTTFRQQMIFHCISFLFFNLLDRTAENERLLTTVEKMNHCLADENCVRTRWEIQPEQGRGARQVTNSNWDVLTDNEDAV